MTQLPRFYMHKKHKARAAAWQKTRIRQYGQNISDIEHVARGLNLVPFAVTYTTLPTATDDLRGRLHKSTKYLQTGLMLPVPAVGVVHTNAKSGLPHIHVMYPCMPSSVFDLLSDSRYAGDYWQHNLGNVDIAGNGTTFNKAANAGGFGKIHIRPTHSSDNQEFRRRTKAPPEPKGGSYGDYCLRTSAAGTSPLVISVHGDKFMEVLGIPSHGTAAWRSIVGKDADTRASIYEQNRSAH